MKIEKLEFENINSLKGHYTIDFTHPELAGDGIFVITGPTGAGKTTLLDAISFALYAKTPRQGGVSQDRNELMSRGADSCMAGVTFSHGGKRYTVTTSQQRTRRSSRNPFAESKRTFEEFDETGRVVTTANQKTLVGNKVEACTGLNFDNFKRCMMLAQGEFATFMKADEKDRAQVLTTITGTEIYEQIGQELHNVVDEKKRVLDAMTTEPTLPQEERLALEESRKDLEQQKQDKGTQLAQVDTLVRWLDNCTAAAGEYLEDKRKRAAARAAMQDFRSGGNLARMESARKAARVQPAHSSLEHARRNLVATQRRLQAAQEAVQELEPVRRAAETGLQAAQEQLQNESPDLTHCQERIDRELRPLEQQVALATQAADSARNRAESAATQALSAKKTADQARKASSKADQALQESRTRLAACTADAELGSVLAAAKLCLVAWEQADPTGQKLAPTQQIQERLEELRPQRDALLQGRSREHLADMDKAWAYFNKHAATLDQAELAELAAKAALEQLEKTVLPDLEAAQEQVDKREDACRLIRERADIQTKLDELYREFAEGKRPCCPCCGSTTPGKHRPAAADRALEEAEAAREQAKKELQTARRRHTTHANALETARKELDSATRRHAQLVTQMAHHTAALQLDHKPENPQAAHDEIKQALHTLEQLDREIAALEQQLPAAGHRDELHRQLNAFTRTLPHTLTAAKELYKELDQRAMEYAAATRAVTDGERQVAAQQAMAAEKAQAAAQAQETAATAAAESATKAEALATLRKEKEAAWGNDSADALTNAIRSRLAALDTAAQAARERLNQADTALQRQQSLLESETRQAAENRTALERAEQEFTAALQREGFADEQAYATAKLHLTALEELETRYQALDRAVTAMEERQSNSAERFRGLRRQHPRTTRRAGLLEQRAAAAAAAEAADSALVEVLARITQDNAALARNADMLAQRAPLEQDFHYWDLLHKVLGGSKEGFKRYAQQITFQNLLICANERLHLLTNRYSLLQTPDGKLGLLVVDHWQDEEKPRAASNLSGGESFIVSLALALGLAQMADSETQLDTLFLDEGFGTLDGDQLEKVLDSLERLRAGGKLIGLITHVDQLKERITCNLSICPGGTSGFSTIDSHPAVTRGTEATKSA